jgi:PAS domain S-box-containing protein
MEITGKPEPLPFPDSIKITKLPPAMDETIYGLLFENMLDGYAYCRMIYEDGQPQDFIYLAVNPAFETLTGLKDVVGKRVSQVIPNIRQSDPELFDIYSRVALGGVPQRFEMYVQSLGIWFSISVFSIQKETFTAVFENISVRREAEAQLRYQADLLAYVHEAVIASDKNYILTAWNQSAETIYGWKAEEVLGRFGIDVLQTVFPEADKARMLQEINVSGHYIGEATQVRKDGTRFPVEVASIVLHDSQGQIRGYISLNRDISDRKRAAEEIAKLARFPSENPYPVIRVDREGAILYANPAGRRLLSTWGCTEGDLSPQFLREKVDEAFEKQAAQIVETESGGRFFSVSIVPVVNSDYANLYGSDITERKQAEEVLERERAELARSNAELEQFAYVASHDLQEPLRMVSSYMQLLERRYKGRLDQDADDFIGFAVDGAERMQHLINDLLAYSRVGTRGKPFEPISCNNVLELALDNLQLAIQDNKASVTHDPLPEVTGDEAQLVQLFQNLIANAVKFHREEKPQVHIGVQEGKKEWVFSVRDNGIGIDPQYAERIFVIFQRLHSRTQFQGTGIGLAICKKIVQRHGGRIWVESQPGKGATFFFTLPKKEGLRSGIQEQ